MRLGLLLPTRDHLLDGRPMASLLQLAVDAEAAGLDSVWVGDSPLARPRYDAFTTLAAVAARTARIAIGTAVLLAPLRHPLLVLHQSATVDLISCGRLVLGLGAGFPFGQTEAQFAAVEADYTRRGARLDDTIRLAHEAWRGARGPFAGRTLSVDDTALEPRPHQADGPPIWLAGSGERSLRRVGELADGWLPYAPTPDRYAADLAVVRDHAAKAGRRPPAAALYVTAAFDDDPVAARAAAAEAIEVLPHSVRRRPDGAGHLRRDVRRVRRVARRLPRCWCHSRCRPSRRHAGRRRRHRPPRRCPPAALPS